MPRKFQKIPSNKSYKYWVLLLLVSASASISSCKKTAYNSVSDAAYLRVFNSLNYNVDVTNKGYPLPFVTMIIDPEFDKNGLVASGKIVGDYLDKRLPYAPPYPSNAGNTSFANTEYPGTEKVLVGQVLNGIDLSSWAQVPSGKHRILFYTRPYNATPFFSLAERDRKALVIDTTIELNATQVYTMEVLQRNIRSSFTLEAALYMRKETFTETAFSDSLLYVNFYNLSAEGYAAANPNAKRGVIDLIQNATNVGGGYSDTMNVYYSLYKNDARYPLAKNSKPSTVVIPSYYNLFLTTLLRSFHSNVAPYFSMPMFAGGDTTGGILSMQWEMFSMLKPGQMPGAIGSIGCSNISSDGKGSTFSVPGEPNSGRAIAGAWLPNLIKYSASGNYVQRSFATISSIEIINDQIYMMSVQRSYPPPSK